MRDPGRAASLPSPEGPCLLLAMGGAAAAARAATATAATARGAVAHALSARGGLRRALRAALAGRSGAQGNKMRMTVGLPNGAVMNCADNSGAKNLYIFAVTQTGARLNRLPAASAWLAGRAAASRTDLTAPPAAAAAARRYQALATTCCAR